ncbi:alpha/beta hydrolase [Microbacterium sp.]|uniref:alpha/beta fold hydrolase n=1 Tax=Microbacterium sp. TaxID=51671 RepID=UPI0028115030|nr:alpha/beta hydrolase [Microbacterium sp.]
MSEGRFIESSVGSSDGTPIWFRTSGAGEDLLILGGSLRSAEHYIGLATALASDFRVHVIDRRGRGLSGPQGPEYSLAREVEDVLAVQHATGARLAFGHSFGGLVLLEAALRSDPFERVAVYEPGVPMTPVATEWFEPYEQRLAAGDPRGAFVDFLRGSGGAPPMFAKLPHWYLRLALRVGFRGDAWLRIRQLLETNLAEHRVIAAQVGRTQEFRAVSAAVLIMSGDRSAKGTAAELGELARILPAGELVVLPRLDHFAPEATPAAAVVSYTRGFLRPPSPLRNAYATD